MNSRNCHVRSSGRELHSHDPTAAQAIPLDKKRVQLYVAMAKAKSSLATQIKSEKIGLAALLHPRKPPGTSLQLAKKRPLRMSH